MRKILLLTGLLLPVFACADVNQDIVQRAFESIDRDFQEQWAFTESTTSEEIEQIGRYDPRLPDGERWKLLFVDGREPAEDEIEDFQEDKKKDRPRRRGKDERGEDEEDERDNAAMVNFETLELIEETGDYWLFSFIPNEEDDDDSKEFMRQVDGQLKVIKDGHYVEYIDLRNDAPIKPATGVKISKFVTTISFGPAVDGGPIVPLAIDVEVKGRAMLVIKFDTAETIRYSDFEYAGI